MTTQDRRRILVVEDDARMRRSLCTGLEAAGYEVQTAGTGEEGFFLVYSSRPDLVVLDVSLPGRNGLTILKQLRDELVDLRVLVLTSHNEVEDRVAGLRAGADDYLGKPFSFEELLARIEALLRRAQTPPPAKLFRVADLELNTVTRCALRGGTDLLLTEREFALLQYLVDNQGRTVSREQLAKEVWQEGARFSPLDNVIDVQMTRLRRKVDDPFSLKLLHTIRGIGFSLRVPAP